MGRVRVFYGHEGVVPPTGSKSRSAAPAQPEDAEVEVDEIVADDPNGEPVELVGELVEEGEDENVQPGAIVNADGSEVETDENDVPVLTDATDGADANEESEAEEAELPNGDWTVSEIEDWAKNHDPAIDLTGATKTKQTRLARISEALEDLTKGE